MQPEVAVFRSILASFFYSHLLPLVCGCRITLIQSPEQTGTTGYGNELPVHQRNITQFWSTATRNTVI